MCLFIHLNSGAPAGAFGAPGRSSIPIEVGKSIKPRKFGGRPRPSIRTYVRTYAQIRPGDKFIFVLDLESFLRKRNTKTFFGLLRVNLNVIETCKNTVLLQRFFFSCFLMIWTVHFNLNEAVV